VFFLELVVYILQVFSVGKLGVVFGFAFALSEWGDVGDEAEGVGQQVVGFDG
jgi:hypothetical protein